MKAAVKKLANDTLSQDEFAEAIWIAMNYRQNRLATLERLFELDGKIGIPLPTHRHYQIKYRGVVKSIDYYCKTDLEEGIRRYIEWFRERRCQKGRDAGRSHRKA